MNQKQKKDKDRKVMFIVGCPRSGTTWLMWLLAHHPSVVVCYHAAFFHAIQDLHSWWQDDVGYGKSIYASDPERSDVTEQDTKAGQKKFLLNRLLSMEEFYGYSRSMTSHVFDKIATCGTDTEVVVEKTPENLQFADWILKILPNAYFLHIIRDPRSVYSSSCKAAYSWADPKEFPTSPIQAAKRWCSYMILGRRVQAKTDRYKEVRYESLFSDGPEILKGIYDWLDLDADMASCERALEASTIDKMRKRDGLAPKGFFRKGSTDAWRNELSVSEVRSIEYIAGKFIDEKGYERMLEPAEQAPLRVRVHEMGSEMLHSLGREPKTVVMKLLRKVPLVSRFRPGRRIEILRSTISKMAR